MIITRKLRNGKIWGESNTFFGGKATCFLGGKLPPYPPLDRTPIEYKLPPYPPLDRTLIEYEPPPYPPLDRTLIEYKPHCTTGFTISVFLSSNILKWRKNAELKKHGTYGSH